MSKALGFPYIAAASAMNRESAFALGEFRLIARIASIVGDAEAVMGIGDDTAVLDTGGSEYLLATVDISVEGVHFRRSWDHATVGRRAISSSLSDVAAMGGTPHFALTSIAVPPEIGVDVLDALYTGMQMEARSNGVSIVGGNVSRVDGPLMIDVVMLGSVPPDELVLRRGAMPGDSLAVTGTLGAAAAELQQVERFPKTGYTYVSPSRVMVSRALASARIPHAMIDLSDGLGSDIAHLATASGTGAVIYEKSIPISVTAARLASSVDHDPLDYALFGGEDYELLFALSPEDLARAQRVAGNVRITEVGTVVSREDGIVLEQADGKRRALEPRGWTHF